MNLPRGIRDRLKSLEEYFSLAAIVSLSLAAATIFLWLMYDGRGMPTAAERGALLNTLLLCDAVAFIVTAVAALLCLYVSSLYSGDYRGAIGTDAYVLFFVVMLAPLAFLSADIAWKPGMLAGVETLIACVLSAIAIIGGILFVAIHVHHLRPRERIRAMIGRILEEYHVAGATATAGAIAIVQPTMAGPSLDLFGMLKRSLQSGDPGPARSALDNMAKAALEAADRAPDARSLAIAQGMVAHVIEAGAIAAAAGSESIVCHTIECLRDIIVDSGTEQVATAAFRGIGYTYGECMRHVGHFRTLAMEAWLAGIYASIYDDTGKREALDKASAAADRALADGSVLTTEERSRALFASGQVLRRLAEAERSEEKALLAISRLDEARTIGSGSPLDAALVDAEIGQAYVALAPMKNPIKSYKKALSLFQDAGKTLTADVSRFDAALLQSREGYAHSMLADEYNRARRYDDALNSARSAIERYKSAAKYFTSARSEEEHSVIMSGAGLAHTLICEVYTHARDFDDALKHATLAINCYTAALDAVGKERDPESYASLKVSIGVAQMDLAEICFKEKRYDEAINACDSAIAAYNEALRIYEGEGKEKLAAPARKQLKEANDLFNTFMMIGTGKSRQAELGDAL
jgi:tetratricopeptide (TPR) repeat protein